MGCYREQKEYGSNVRYRKVKQHLAFRTDSLGCLGKEPRDHRNRGRFIEDEEQRNPLGQVEEPGQSVKGLELLTYSLFPVSSLSIPQSKTPSGAEARLACHLLGGSPAGSDPACRSI